MDLNCAPYKPDSKILIITLDCFRKKKGGVNDYDVSSSIRSEVPEYADWISETRQKIFYKLKNCGIKWEGYLEEIHLNDNLKNGMDFGGDDKNVLYIPAIERYDGDFFTGLGDEGRKNLQASHHHFLIISGLYGILRPYEPIQHYACQFGDKNSAFHEWANRKNNITKIITSYVKKVWNKKDFLLPSMQCSCVSGSIEMGSPPHECSRIRGYSLLFLAASGSCTAYVR